MCRTCRPKAQQHDSWGAAPRCTHDLAKIEIEGFDNACFSLRVREYVIVRQTSKVNLADMKCIVATCPKVPRYPARHVHVEQQAHIAG